MKERMCLWSQWKPIPGLQILWLRWPAAEGSEVDMNQESEGTRIPWLPPPGPGSFYWISEKNVYEMTTILLKTGRGGKLVGGRKKSSHSEWNERVFKKFWQQASCLTGWSNSFALRGNFLYWRTVSWSPNRSLVHSVWWKIGWNSRKLAIKIYMMRGIIP